MRKLTYLKSDHTDKVVAKFGKDGGIKVLLRTITHKNFDGGVTIYGFPWVVLERGDSVAILIHNVAKDEVILVQQFRPAILRTIFELPAGTLKPDEARISCVYREVYEEVGVNVSDVEMFSTFYASPGATSERIFMYYAPVSNLGPDGMFGGLKEEGENIQKVVLSVDEALEMVEACEIDDAKTILALLWLKDQRKK